MDIGLCISPQAASGLPEGAFDFLEANVQSLLVPEADEAIWKLNLISAEGASRPIRAANCFLPGAMKCLGPAADRTRLLRYADNAFRRAREVGIEVIVFGSGAARALPNGYSREQAMEQFVDLLRALGPVADLHSILLVIEPLHPGECTFINSLADGAEAVLAADHPRIQVLADTYHMRMNDESPDEIRRFGGVLKHFHVAERADRGWPGRTRENLRPFYTALKAIDYGGRLSIECRWEELGRDLEASTRFLREELASAGF